MEHTNKFNSNFVGSKQLKMTCLSVQAVILLLISVFPPKIFLLVGAVDVVVTLYHLTQIKSIVSRTRGAEVWEELRDSQLRGCMDLIASDNDSIGESFANLKAYLSTTEGLRNIPRSELTPETDIGQ